jgi:hypothetical protein
MTNNIGGTVTTLVSLNASYNPTSIVAGGLLTAGLSASSIVSDWTIANGGSIQTNTAGFGIELASAGTVLNTGSVAGSMTGPYSSGITRHPGGSVTMGPRYSYGNGIYLQAGGSVVNGTGGVVSGYRGVQAIGIRTQTVSNAGMITGNATASNGTGIFIGSGYVTNATGGTIGGHRGIFSTGALTIANAGAISGSNEGIDLPLSSGLIVNRNGGSISGGFAGIYGDGIGANRTSLLTVVNDGIIGAVSGPTYGLDLSFAFATNRSDGTIEGVVGVRGNGSLTLTNAGTIVGTQYAVRFAASFGGNNSRLIVDPGASFSGTVSGGVTVGSTYVSTLELASGSSAGTIGGFGTQYTGFSQTTIDAGASWTLTGTNAFAAGTTLTNAGTLTLLNATASDAGSVVNNGIVLIDPSSLTLASLSGIGTVAIAAASMLTVTGSIGAGQTIEFTGNTGSFAFDPTLFSGTIAGLQAGDTLGLTGITNATSATVVNGNTLQIALSSGGPVDLTLENGRDFSGGTFAVTADGIVTNNEAPCFLRDTFIRTDRGEVPVQDLAVGDKIVTLSGAYRPIVWIGMGRGRRRRGSARPSRR